MPVVYMSPIPMNMPVAVCNRCSSVCDSATNETMTYNREPVANA